MSNPKVALAVACAGLLAACSSGQPEDLSQADIANVADLESEFGPSFTVSTVGPAAIEPGLLGPQSLPEGLVFDPPDCAEAASKLAVPAGVQGNMAATTAEGDGVRYIVIAVETSEPVPASVPTEQCQEVVFGGRGIRGLIKVVEAPQIDNTQVVGTRRVLQTTAGGAPRTGDLYNYVANFGNFIVIVTANSLVIPGQPLVPVDTARARELVTQAVSLVRG
ncbi:MAG: DUF5642 family protein [Mycobacterium sp.]